MTEPQIIRQNSPHQVTVGEGSSVAGSKSSDPNGPSIRKTLAGESPVPEKEAAPAPQVPPPVSPRPPAAQGQQFSRSLAAEGAAQAAPQAFAGEAASQGMVFERSMQDGQGQQVGAGAAETGRAQGASFERGMQDQNVQAPPQEGRGPGPDGPVVAQALNDRFVAAPEEGPRGASAGGPVVESALKDRFVPAPDGIPRGDNIQQVTTEGPRDNIQKVAIDSPAAENLQRVPLDGGPADNIQRVPGEAPPSENVQRVPLDGSAAPNLQRVPMPDGPGENLQRVPVQTPSGEELRGPSAAGTDPNIQFLPPETARRQDLPAISPATAAASEPAVVPTVPLAEAQVQVAQLAQEVQTRVEETLGAADQEWVEMDFPARVIKLKVENEKVRTKLDKLEAMARQPLR